MEGDPQVLGRELQDHRRVLKSVVQPYHGCTRCLRPQCKSVSPTHFYVVLSHLQCQAYLRLEDIYVGGFVLYTGTAEAGQRAAGVFAGSPLILELVNKKQADIKELVDYLTTVIKYVSFPSMFCYINFYILGTIALMIQLPCRPLLVLRL